MKNSTIKKAFYMILMLFLGLFTGCAEISTGPLTLKELGLDQLQGQLCVYIDTHGALGEGGTLIKYELWQDDSSTIEQGIEENGNWSSLPLTEQLQTAVYGEGAGCSLKSLLQEQRNAIPAIAHGYYYFYDRHTESTDHNDDTFLLSRGSLNFDLFLYDRDQHTLYILRMDT